MNLFLESAFFSTYWNGNIWQVASYMFSAKTSNELPKKESTKNDNLLYVFKDPFNISHSFFCRCRLKICNEMIHFEQGKNWKSEVMFHSTRTSNARLEDKIITCKEPWWEKCCGMNHKQQNCCFSQVTSVERYFFALKIKCKNDNTFENYTEVKLFFLTRGKHLTTTRFIMTEL